MTNTVAAHALGFTGAGYRIAVVDTGVNRNHPALQGRVSENFIYVDPKTNNVSIDDANGHGTTVAQLAAGRKAGTWPGGIAPDAGVVSARIIQDIKSSDDGSGQGNQVNDGLGMHTVHEDLIRAGARIMNNSWGGLYWTNPAVTNQVAQEYRRFIFSNDGLVVFAAGNDAKSTPSIIAALPSQPGPNATLPASDLERGWLVAAALDTMHPTQLASYSNACGIAMRYCLVAPGTAVFPDPNNNVGNITYYYGSGTSFAAPLVSGAAALVWQAFPYFTNDMVRQTLLGTATDLGAAGVDPVFGYGLLNAGKAVLGPARFDWGDMDVTVNIPRSTWANAISGNGGLIKRGSGTLVLSSINNTFGGNTQILGGTLQTASLQSPQVVIGSGARLASTGTIAGHVSNAGTLEVGGSVLQISGNYRQTADSRLAVTVGDSLSVAGSATLSGGELQVLGKRDYVSFNTAYTVLQAAGGLQGRFASLTWGPSVLTTSQGTLRYDSNNAYLTLQRLDVTAAAAAFGGISATAMDSAIRVEQAFRQIDAQQASGSGTIHGDFIQAAVALQQSPTVQAATSSLRSLSGRVHAQAIAMSFDTIDLGRRTLAWHVDTLSAWPALFSVWQQAMGGAGQGGGVSNGFATTGWMMGSDMRLGSNAVAGVAFGESRSDSIGDIDFAQGHGRQLHGQAYWALFQGPSYALGQVGFGRFNRQIQRSLQFGETFSSAFSQYNASFLTGSLEAGYRWGNVAASLTPYVGVDYVRLRHEGFRESGGSGFGLRADASTSTRTQLLMGLRGSVQLRGIQLRGYAEWQQALTSRGLTLDASFIGTDAWVPLRDVQPARSGGLLGLSAVTSFGRNAELNFGIDRYIGMRAQDYAFNLRYALGF